MSEDHTPESPESDDLRELLGAYALDALDADERAAVEAHVLRDQEARAELHALQLGAAWLEQSAERPSSKVWEAVAAEMASDLAHDVTRAGAGDANGHVAVMPIRRRSSVVTRTLALAAAFVAVVAIAGGVRAVLDGPGESGTTPLASSIDVAKAKPGARAVVLETTKGASALEAVVLQDGSGVAVPRDLATLDAHRTYQLWAITADGPVSLGTMGADPRPLTFSSVRGMTALALTREPRGGSPRPTGIPVATGDLATA